jgi:HAD superfamily hydrolase (TIGR01450 family)
MTRIEGFMFDVDGTLLLSDRALGSYEVLPGAVEVLAALKERSVPFALLTNGSAYPPQEQAAKLRRIGLPVENSQMVTPSSVMADYVSGLGMKRVLVLGTRGVGQALRDSGIQTVYTGEPDASRVDAVYVGWHPDCGMKDIEAACEAIWNGAKLYAASDVPFFATKQGRTIGYTFAIVGAIRRLTKARVVVTGKPSLRALRFVANRLGVSVRKMGVVGDDPLVEAVMARRAGATMFAVTTGTTTRQEWLQQPAMRRPHRILDGLGDLLKSGSEVF